MRLCEEFATPRFVRRSRTILLTARIEAEICADALIVEPKYFFEADFNEI